jgi:hypothetical protein
VAGLLLGACGAAATGEESSAGGAERTATFQTSATQIAEAKAKKATATVAATATPEPLIAATPTVVPWLNVTPSPPYQGDIMTELTLLGELPGVYKMLLEGPVTAKEIAAAYPDEQGFLAKLEAWGFRQAGQRQFLYGVQTGPDLPKQMNFFHSAILEFGTPEQAADSMQSNRAYIKKSLVGNPPDQAIEGLGDYAIAIEGQLVGSGRKLENWAFVWVRQGNLCFIFRGSSPASEPMQKVIEVAQKTLAH